MPINFDLENSPLYLKTNSEFGSNEQVSLRFTSKNEMAGGVLITFSSPPQAKVKFCFQLTDFLTSLPSEADKVWKITLSKTSDIRLFIHCNDVEVVNVQLSESVCNSNSDWNTYWSRDVDRIVFLSSDTASDFYSTDPGISFSNVAVMIIDQPLIKINESKNI